MPRCVGSSNAGCTWPSPFSSTGRVKVTNRRAELDHQPLAGAARDRHRIGWPFTTKVSHRRQLLGPHLSVGGLGGAVLVVRSRGDLGTQLGELGADRLVSGVPTPNSSATLVVAAASDS